MTTKNTARRKQLLTDRLLAALAKSTAPVTVYDTLVSGFHVRRQTEGGRLAYAIHRRQRGGNGQPLRRSIGLHPSITLGDARQQARAMHAMLECGRDPKQVEAERIAAENLKREHSVAALAEKFLAGPISKARTAKAIEQRLRRDVITRWGERAITDITKADIVAMVEEIAGERGPEAARRSLTFAKLFFAWLCDRDLLAHSPANA